MMSSVGKLTLRPTAAWQFFTDQEAWRLFRLAAIGEAVGWTLLITGILIGKVVTPGNADAVQIAGQLHGILFITYLLVALATGPSLRWSAKRMVVAVLASVPPYATLVFEQWAARRRRAATLKSYRQLVVRAVIRRDQTVLALQPRDRVAWCLPGGPVPAGETAEVALQRMVANQTGVKPVLGGLCYVFEQPQRVELFFSVSNAADFQHVKLKTTPHGAAEFDELAFVRPSSTVAVEPAFLSAQLAHGQSQSATDGVRFFS